MIEYIDVCDKIHRHRMRRIRGLMAAVEAELLRQYIVIPCKCGHDVHSDDATFCGGCGKPLPKGEG